MDQSIAHGGALGVPDQELEASLLDGSEAILVPRATQKSSKSTKPQHQPTTGGNLLLEATTLRQLQQLLQQAAAEAAATQPTTQQPCHTAAEAATLVPGRGPTAGRTPGHVVNSPQQQHMAGMGAGVSWTIPQLSTALTTALQLYNQPPVSTNSDHSSRGVPVSPSKSKMQGLLHLSGQQQQQQQQQQQEEGTSLQPTLQAVWQLLQAAPGFQLCSSSSSKARSSSDSPGLQTGPAAGGGVCSALPQHNSSLQCSSTHMSSISNSATTQPSRHPGPTRSDPAAGATLALHLWLLMPPGAPTHSGTAAGASSSTPGAVCLQACSLAELQQLLTCTGQGCAQAVLVGVAQHPALLAAAHPQRLVQLLEALLAPPLEAVSPAAAGMAGPSTLGRGTTRSSSGSSGLLAGGCGQVVCILQAVASRLQGKLPHQLVVRCIEACCDGMLDPAPPPPPPPAAVGGATGGATGATIPPTAAKGSKASAAAAAKGEGGGRLVMAGQDAASLLWLLVQSLAPSDPSGSTMLVGSMPGGPPSAAWGLQVPATTPVPHAHARGASRQCGTWAPGVTSSHLQRLVGCALQQLHTLAPQAAAQLLVAAAALQGCWQSLSGGQLQLLGGCLQRMVAAHPALAPAALWAVAAAHVCSSSHQVGGAGGTGPAAQDSRGVVSAVTCTDTAAGGAGSVTAAPTAAAAYLQQLGQQLLLGLLPGPAAPAAAAQPLQQLSSSIQWSVAALQLPGTTGGAEPLLGLDACHPPAPAHAGAGLQCQVPLVPPEPAAGLMCQEAPYSPRKQAVVSMLPPPPFSPTAAAEDYPRSGNSTALAQPPSPGGAPGGAGAGGCGAAVKATSGDGQQRGQQHALSSAMLAVPLGLLQEVLRQAPTEVLLLAPRELHAAAPDTQAGGTATPAAAAAAGRAPAPARRHASKWDQPSSASAPLTRVPPGVAAAVQRPWEAPHTAAGVTPPVPPGGVPAKPGGVVHSAAATAAEGASSMGAAGVRAGPAAPLMPPALLGGPAAESAGDTYALAAAIAVAKEAAAAANLHRARASAGPAVGAASIGCGQGGAGGTGSRGAGAQRFQQLVVTLPGRQLPPPPQEQQLAGCPDLEEGEVSGEGMDTSPPAPAAPGSTAAGVAHTPGVAPGPGAPVPAAATSTSQGHGSYAAAPAAMAGTPVSKQGMQGQRVPLSRGSPIAKDNRGAKRARSRSRSRSRSGRRRSAVDRPPAHNTSRSRSRSRSRGRDAAPLSHQWRQHSFSPAGRGYFRHAQPPPRLPPPPQPQQRWSHSAQRYQGHRPPEQVREPPPWYRGEPGYHPHHQQQQQQQQRPLGPPGIRSRGEWHQQQQQHRRRSADEEFHWRHTHQQQQQQPRQQQQRRRSSTRGYQDRGPDQQQQQQQQCHEPRTAPYTLGHQEEPHLLQFMADAQQPQQQGREHAAPHSPPARTATLPTTPPSAAACVAPAAQPLAAACALQAAEGWGPLPPQGPAYSSPTPPPSSLDASDQQRDTEEGEVATSADVPHGTGGALCPADTAVPTTTPGSAAIRTGTRAAAAAAWTAAAPPPPPPPPPAAPATVPGVGFVGDCGPAAGRSTPDVPPGRREVPWQRQTSPQLLAWIKGATCAEDLLRLLLHQPYALSAAHLLAVLHQLAALQGSSRQGWGPGGEEVLQQVGHLLTTGAEEVLEAAAPRTLADLLGRLGRSRAVDLAGAFTNVWHALEAKLAAGVAGGRVSPGEGGPVGGGAAAVHPADVVVALEALAAMPEAWADALLPQQAVQRWLGVCLASRDLGLWHASCLLAALLQLGRRLDQPQQLADLVTRATPRLARTAAGGGPPPCKVIEWVATLLWASAKMGVRLQDHLVHPLLAPLKWVVRAHQDPPRLQDLAAVLWGVATLGCSMPPDCLRVCLDCLFDQLRAAEQQGSDTSPSARNSTSGGVDMPRVLADTAWAVVSLGHHLSSRQQQQLVTSYLQAGGAGCATRSSTARLLAAMGSMQSAVSTQQLLQLLQCLVGPLPSPDSPGGADPQPPPAACRSPLQAAPQGLSGEEASAALWAVAALDAQQLLQEPGWGLLQQLMTAAGVSASSVTARARACSQQQQQQPQLQELAAAARMQLFLFHVWAGDQGVAALPPADAASCRAAWDADRDAGASLSDRQRSVVAALQRLATRHPGIKLMPSGRLTQDGLYRVPVGVTLTPTTLQALHHPPATGSDDGPPRSQGQDHQQRPVIAAVEVVRAVHLLSPDMILEGGWQARLRGLAARGWAVLQVPWFAWQELAGDAPQEEQYLWEQLKQLVPLEQ